jgi:hypothetical protein
LWRPSRSSAMSLSIGTGTCVQETRGIQRSDSSPPEVSRAFLHTAHRRQRSALLVAAGRFELPMTELIRKLRNLISAGFAFCALAESFIRIYFSRLVYGAGSCPVSRPKYCPRTT